MAVIEIETTVTGLSDRFECHEVLIDGERRGTVKGGQTGSFEVSPGIHTIRLKLASHSSPSVKVVVGFGTTSVLCQTKGRRRFGLFPTSEPMTQIQVREEREAPTGGSRRPWCGEDIDVPARLAHALGD